MNGFVRPFTNVLPLPCYLTVRSKGGGRHEVDPGGTPKGKRGGIRLGTAPALCIGAAPFTGPELDNVGGADGDRRSVHTGCTGIAECGARRNRSGPVGVRSVGKLRVGGYSGVADQNVMKARPAYRSHPAEEMEAR